MYRKVLIPLDGSKEAEGVFDLVQEELAPDGQIILLQVIPRVKGQVVGGQVMYGAQLEEAERSKADVYLIGVLRRLKEGSVKGSCEVVASESIPQSIVDFAEREGVDLIAMYTHDRKGLARIIRGSIAKKVQGKASIEVRIIKPRELALV